MRRYGKGDLCGITVQNETRYGYGDGEKTHLGVMTGLKIEPGITTEEQVNCGSRLMGTKYLMQRDWTATVDLKVSKSADWIQWFEWCLGTDSDGSVSGLRNTPSGRTVICKVAPGSTDVLRGAYVNELTVTSEKLGAPLRFSASLYAKAVDIDTDDTGSAIASGTPLRCTQGWHCSNASIGTVTAGDWKLTITQNLEKVPDADADEVTNANGQEPYLGTPEVKLEINTPARSRDLDRLRASLTQGLTFATQIGGHALTLSGCILGNDGTQRGQDPYNETISVTATDISIV